MAFGFGKIAQQRTVKELEDWKWLRHIEKKKIKKPDFTVYPERYLNVFIKHYHQSWLDEGITHEAMKKFNIMWHQRSERIVIPHRSSDGRLIGVRGRSTREWK